MKEGKNEANSNKKKTLHRPYHNTGNNGLAENGNVLRKSQLVAAVMGVGLRAGTF